MAPVEAFEGVPYDQAEDLADFALLPDGPRTVQIEDVTEGKRSAQGNRTYAYKAKLLNPPTEPAPKGPAGEPQKWPTHLYIRMNSSPKTISFWKKLFIACNTKWQGNNVNPNLLVGKKLIVDVVHREYMGTMRNDIKPAGFHPAK